MSELEPEETTPVEPDVVAIPRELAVLPLRDTVVFPESMTPLAIGQERSIKLVDDVVGGDRMLALLATRDPENEQPGFKDLYEVGTAAVIHKMIRVPDGTLRILVQGLRRIRLEEPVQVEPYLVGRFVEVPDVLEETPEVEALTRNVQALFARIIALVPYLPEELELAAANVDDPSALCHLVASTLRLKTQEKQELLEDVSVEQRLRHVSRILNRELEVFELGTRIQSQVQSEMEKGQREFFLRQQLKAIQDELGESDPERAEVEELRERLHAIPLPEDVRKAAERELSRLERLPSAAAEHGVIRTYLEWILTLPVGRLHARQPGPRARPDGARPRPLRPREGEGADHRVPRRLEAEGRPERADPLLRRSRRVSARRRSATRSRTRSSASSSASRSEASATRRRSAATGARTSARCRERSSARSATPSRRTRCS